MEGSASRDAIKVRHPCPSSPDLIDERITPPLLRSFQPSALLSMRVHCSIYMEPFFEQKFPSSLDISRRGGQNMESEGYYKKGAAPSADATPGHGRITPSPTTELLYGILTFTSRDAGRLVSCDVIR